MGVATDAELLARALRNPGRLCLSPSTTSGAFPYGGTSLGFTRGIRVRFDVRYDRRYDPASGALVEIGRQVENLVLLGLMDGWDEDMLTAIFTATTAAASLTVASPAEVAIDAATTPKLVPAQLPILFAALDPAHKSVYIRRPVVTIDRGDPLVEFSIARKAGLPFEIEPTMPSGKKAWQIRRLENLDLS